MCNCCNGDEAIFWKDENDNAFIDSNGEMLVTADGHETRFQVDRCPKCGRLFKGVNYLNLRHGDDIWYADEDENIVEHGIVDIVTIRNNKVDTFSVNFDNGDFDVFDGSGLGKHYFMHKVDAEEALVRPVEQSVFEQPDTLAIGDHIWYVDKDARCMQVEHCVVQHVTFDNNHIDWFSAKFDNGDVEEFGPCALGIYCFKSKEAAEFAWKLEHDAH